jgi:hypothetical protein
LATLASSYPALGTSNASDTSDRSFAVVLVSVLTVMAIVVHGYHPYAEDGGLYVAGVKRLLEPALYPHQAEFVLAPMRHSLFAPLVAFVARAAGWTVGPDTALPWVLLGLHLTSIWATLFAAWMLVARCHRSRAARAGAVVLLACWLGLPVAGTALMLMDPYLTARSLATPCMVLALVGALDMTSGDATRRRVGLFLCSGAIAAAAALHPLMAAYALGSVFVLILVRAENRTLRLGGTVGVLAGAIALAATVHEFTPHESAAYVRIALTRTYWYPRAWEWYEGVGLVAPLLILAWFGVRQSARSSWRSVAQTHVAKARHGAPRLVEAGTALARMGMVVGVCACVVALLFARQDAATHFVARLQPLRAFQVVYLLMILALGGWLGEHGLRRYAGRWIGKVTVLGVLMFVSARLTYPASSHMELPWRGTSNPWVTAFTWIRLNTPKDALFAMDANYISQSDEDAQCFRAVAERSALPDYSKDGGEASIAPDLTEAWVAGQAAQRDLSAIPDAERIQRLRSLGVSWVVLKSAAVTSFECPYRNDAVQVCQLR